MVLGEQEFHSFVRKFLESGKDFEEDESEGIWAKKISDNEFIASYIQGEYKVQVNENGNLIFTILQRKVEDDGNRTEKIF